MKNIAIALFLLMLSVDVAFGQAAFIGDTVDVPHIAVGGEANGQNYVTLVQLVNNNSVGITGHVALYSDNGSPLTALFDGQGPQSAIDIVLADGETRQIQVTLDAGLKAGWMQIKYSPSAALTTVIVQFRSGSTVLSEVGVDPTLMTIEGTDFAAETDDQLNTGIAIANPNSVPAYVFVGLWDSFNGAFLSGTTLSLLPNGHIARFLTELFPTVSNVARTRAKVSLDSCSTASCTAVGGSFITTALRLSGDQFTTIPVVERQPAGDLVRILPQVAFGGPATGLNMNTVLYFTTNVTTGVFGTADIFDNDGNPLAAFADGAPPSSSIAFTVAGNRVSRIVLSGDQTLRSGWIRLSLPSTAHLIANAIFQTYSGSTLVSEASVLESAPVQRGLIYVKSQSGRANTGVAFANPEQTPITITLELFDRNGFVSAVRDITLAANGHLAQFVTEIFPQLAAIADFEGALSIHSATTFSAMALRISGEKVATLPVASDGMYRPSINGLGVTSTQRSTGRVNFTIDVRDWDSDIATNSSLNVSGDAYLDFGSSGYDFGPISMDGTAVLDRTSGTITGSFQPPHVTTSIPAGFRAAFYVNIYDAAGNQSNFVAIPITY